MKLLNQIPAAHLRKITGVFTDVDDTLTTGGRLGAEAYTALQALVDKGLRVVPVTGGPAGWCDHMARAWGVDAVIGESGAFYFHYKAATGEFKRRFWYDEEEKRSRRQMLKSARDALLTELPGVRLSSDQGYRELDLAIELVNAKGAPLPQMMHDDIMVILNRRGMNTKKSSIHINAYFGDYDKLTMAELMVKELWNEDLAATRDQWLFIGDSVNDAGMFEFFPLSVGVANVRHVLAELPKPPAYVTAGEGGAGFAEMVKVLLAAK